MTSLGSRGIAALLIAVAAPSAADAADPYFKGRTVTLIVGHAAGGGVDLMARTLSKYLARHIPGEPNVIVKNMPGAGAMQAHNYIFEIAKGDGENVLHGPWFPVHQLLGAPGIRFKYQEFTPIGSYNIPGLVFYGRTDLVPGGIKKGAEIKTAAEIKFGASNPYNTFDLHGRLALELLDVRYRYVTGYRGSAEVRPAMMKNEINTAVDVTSAYRAAIEPTLIKPGIAVPLWSYPERDSVGAYGRSSELKEIPTIIEVYRDLAGREPTGATWQLLDLVMTLQGRANQMVLGPPNMQDAALADLRQGFAATFADAEMIKETRERYGFKPVFVRPELVVDIMKYLMTVPPDLIARLKEHVESGVRAKQ